VPEPKHRAEVLGDFLREAAVLVLVFGPLDYLVSRPFTPIWFGVILVVSGRREARGIEETVLREWR
jgi:hypothetical protein